MSRVLVLAGTRKGAFILESTPSRDSWTVNGPLLKGWEVSELVLDTRGDPTLYAAVGHFVYGATIQRSSDLGDTWEQAATNPEYPEAVDSTVEQIWTIVPGQADEPGVLYAGVADAGLFITRDGGETWAEIEGLRQHETRDGWFPGNGGLCCHSVCVHPDDPDRMWVGISAVGVFRTDDGGASWALKNDGLDVVAPDDAHDNLGSCVHRLVLDPQDPTRLYQQNHMGVYKTTSAGDEWTSIGDGLPSTFGFPIVIDPGDTDTLYTFPLESDEYRMAIDGQPAVYRSTTAGESWERAAIGLPDRSWVTVLRQAMATDPLDPVGVYVGTTGGQIFHSTDAGDTWSTIDCRLPKVLSLTTAVIA